MSSSINFDYKVVYSARRRRLCVCVSPDNRVTVRCPVGTKDADIERFLSEKKAWIMRHVAANASKLSCLSEVLSYKKILVGGKFYDFKLGVKDGIGEGVVCAVDFSHLKDIYVKALAPAFLEEFYALSARCGLSCSGVSFRSYKGRWGCCDGKNFIVFNYKLLMLPREFQYAVMAHELCHTRYYDHSARFHKLLDEIVPQNRLLFRLMSRYSAVARLY